MILNTTKKQIKLNVEDINDNLRLEGEIEFSNFKHFASSRYHPSL